MNLTLSEGGEEGEPLCACGDAETARYNDIGKLLQSTSSGRPIMMAGQTSPSATVTPSLFKREQAIAYTEKKEATPRPIVAFSEATQTMVESLAAAQERNLECAQSVFDGTIAMLTDHMKSKRAFLEQREQ